MLAQKTKSDVPNEAIQARICKNAHSCAHERTRSVLKESMFPSPAPRPVEQLVPSSSRFAIILAEKSILPRSRNSAASLKPARRSSRDDTTAVDRNRATLGFGRSLNRTVHDGGLPRRGGGGRNGVAVFASKWPDGGSAPWVARFLS